MNHNADGVTEAMDKNYQEFGLQRLQDVVAANSEKDASLISEAMVGEVETFVGGVEQPDDLTLVVIKRM